jgi:hypothetical protein
MFFWKNDSLIGILEELHAAKEQFVQWGGAWYSPFPLNVQPSLS